MSIGSDTHAYRRDLPHLQKDGKTYFVTFCTFRRRTLSPAARSIALGCCVHDHKLKYWLHTAIVMPDHAHILLTPLGIALEQILQAIKSASSHAIHQLGMTPPVWQDESFDHILRSEESIRTKADYISSNPVRKRLVATPDEWPWLWREWVEGAAGEGARRHT